MMLKDKVAVVTGAARGIGLATATLFAENGAKVVIADINGHGALEAARRMADEGRDAIAFHADVSDEAAVQAMVDGAVDAYGRIDVLVNNAGVSINQLFLDTVLEDWRKVLDVNLTGAFLVAQRCARVMARQGSGRIINICSLSGQRGGVGRAAYGAAKAGLELLTKVMAVELAEKGINVNGIAPGPIDTEMARVIHTQATREAYLRIIPQHRYGAMDEIAKGAVFLASGMADYVNGHILNIDGGMLTAGLMYAFDQPPSKSF